MAEHPGVNGNANCRYGSSAATQAEIATMSSLVSFSTTPFISTAQVPARSPVAKRWSCRAMFTGGLTGDARHLAQSLERRTVTDGAGNRPAIASRGDQKLPLGEAAGWHIRDEA